jgi:D-alanyl-D-alanine endopeptidase (penicillin-binding protein 7)
MCSVHLHALLCGSQRVRDAFAPMSLNACHMSQSARVLVFLASDIADKRVERPAGVRPPHPELHPVFKNLLLCLLLACGSASWGDIAFRSAHVVVIDEATGEVLLQKDAATAAPIASLTKLMTAMVVLDAQQDLGELIRIDETDRDTLKHSRGGVPVGAVVPRETLLELALIASDNRAAAALARHYPGGLAAFAEATQLKIGALGLANTTLVEPTGLSPDNHASALDMAKVLQATQDYPLIAQITSQRTHAVQVNGRRWAVRNTNGLVGKPGWEVLASKTGFTNEAGRCLTMRLRAGDRTVSVVLIGARAPSARSFDALNIRRWLDGGAPVRVAEPSVSRVRASMRKARAAPVVRVSFGERAAP